MCDQILNIYICVQNTSFIDYVHVIYFILFLQIYLLSFHVISINTIKLKWLINFTNDELFIRKLDFDS